MKYAVLGSGKVGSSLARALRRVGAEVALISARGRWPRRFDADVLIIAVRDDRIREIVARLAHERRLSGATAVLHVAGALDESALAPLRSMSAGVGQAHPMISFAEKNRAPSLEGANLFVAGDAVAQRAALALAEALALRPHAWKGIDRALYHTAGAVVANGATALAGAGAELLTRAGVPERDAARVLGPLLRSVAENIERLGLPGALTGPVRRGDRDTIESHLARLLELPHLLRLYVTLARAQLPLAAALGDAKRKDLRAIERRLSEIARSVNVELPRAESKARRGSRPRLPEIGAGSPREPSKRGKKRASSVARARRRR